MTRQEGLDRLRQITNNSIQILRQLEARLAVEGTEAELRAMAATFRSELQQEFERILPERSQKKMSLYEMTVYAPTIEEVWRDTGISRLKTEGPISDKWNEIFEAIVYKTSKYIS